MTSVTNIPHHSTKNFFSSAIY